jgi:predicted O-methyltransferase YrrM
MPDLPPIPLTGAEDARWSVIGSGLDLRPAPTDQLLDVAFAATAAARRVHLRDLAARSDELHRRYVDVWPGEHYRLLAALVETLRPASIVEVGTFRGHGALSLLAGDDRARVVTYDLIPWPEIEGAALRPEDFATGRLQQRLGDLADPAYLEDQLATLLEADLLFVDGPKDGSWEAAFCELVLPKLTDRARLVVFDDIRLLEMVQLWRDLPFPKLDLTSFGHWSGTGLLQTAPGRQLPVASRTARLVEAAAARAARLGRKRRSSPSETEPQTRRTP